MDPKLTTFFAEERKRLVRVFDERIGEAEEVVSIVTLYIAVHHLA